MVPHRNKTITVFGAHSQSKYIPLYETIPYWVGFAIQCMSRTAWWMVMMVGGRTTNRPWRGSPCTRQPHGAIHGIPYHTSSATELDLNLNVLSLLHTPRIFPIQNQNQANHGDMTIHHLSPDTRKSTRAGLQDTAQDIFLAAGFNPRMRLESRPALASITSHFIIIGK